MRVTHQLLVQIGFDTTTYRKLFWLESQPALQVVVDAYQNECDGIINIPSSGSPSPVPLSFGPVQAVAGIYIEVNNPCTLNITPVGGGAAAGFVLTPNSTVPNTLAKFFAEMRVSALSITANASIPVLGQYAVWGDPTTT
jgi:hypothetical protein